MSARLSSTLRVFLILWASVVLAHFVAVQGRTNGGTIELDWTWYDPWHPMWFGVVNATFALVPYLLFQVPIARRYGGWGSAVGRALLLYGAGVVLWGFGNFYWFVQNVRGVEAPYPSLADAGYLAMLPFAGAALWQLARVVGVRGRDWRWLPVALVVATPLNAWIMLPQGIGAGTFDTPMSSIISTTYILSDVLLLAVAIIIAFGARRAAGGRFLVPVLAIVASLLFLYVGDLFFNYRIANDLFYNADFSDLLYGVFVILGSVAAYLFLVADERATYAAHAAERAWMATGSTDAADDAASGVTLAPLDELATAIVRAQARVIGAQAAHGVADGVSGIERRDDVTEAVDIVAIDALVRDYRSISGPLGEMACWTAARPVLARHPHLEPASLARFRSDADLTAATSTRERSGSV